MNRQSTFEIIYVFILANIAIFVFQIHILIVILALFLFFIYILNRKEKEFKKRTELENFQLMNQIKTSSSSAYLKQKQLNTIVVNIPFPLVLLDVDGKIVLYNAQFETLAEGIENNELTYTNNTFDHSMKRFISDAFIFERRMNASIKIHNKDYEAISIPVTTQRRFSGCVVIFQDVSKLKEKEELQKRFIADASHELKTPISVIKGMIEILNRDSFNDHETQVEFLKQIEEETKRLESIIASLLRLSRVASNQFVLQREMCDLCSIIDSSVASLSYRASAKGIRIETNYQTHESIFIDREQLLVVINNLLSNAIQYSESGTITIRTSIKRKLYVFEIEDEGHGIDAHDLPNIFERFYRVDSARSRNQHGGSGLGLSIVHSIVDAHDANIHVDSSVGIGTRFTITFPLL